jgi:hypothetical protein
LAAARNHIIRLSRVKSWAAFGGVGSVLSAPSVLSEGNPLKLAGQITIRACILIRININSPDAFGTSPPSEIQIFDTRSQKFFDRFGLFLAIFGFARLWLASFDKIFRVVFSIVLSTVIFSKRGCVTTPFIIAIHKYFLALFFVALFFSVLFFAGFFFVGLMNGCKMAFKIVVTNKWLSFATHHATGISLASLTIRMSKLILWLREPSTYIISFSGFQIKGYFTLGA